MAESYGEKVKLALADPEAFWAKVAEGLHWDKKWDQVMDNSDPPFVKWFAGGKLNMCYNCVDRHVDNGDGDKSAVIYESALNQTRKVLSFQDLKQQVSRLAGGLVKLGVGEGDIVVVYMPNVPEAIISFLACARIGIIHTAVPGGLPPPDTAKRIQDSKAKVILTASHGYHLTGWMNYKDEIDKALKLCNHQPTKCIILQRDGMEIKLNSPLYEDWNEFLLKSTEHPCIPVPAESPLFLLYTSGSTGTPKGVIHPTGAYAVRNKLDFNLTLPDLNGALYATTNLGWIASHMLIIYGPLLNCRPGFLFEGDVLFLSDPRIMYRFFSTNQITHCMLRPGILRAMKGLDNDCKMAREYDLSRLKVILMGGEYIDDAILIWTHKAFGAQSVSAYGQTEMAVILSMQLDLNGLDPKIPYFLTGKPAAGVNLVCLREDMTPADPGEIGRFVVKLPLPPGALSTLYQQRELCRELYYSTYPGYFDTKDNGCITESGEVKIEGRADDMIKAGPIYVSGTTIENVISKHPAVVEVAVSGQLNPTHREIPIAFVVRTEGDLESTDLRKELIELVRSHFGTSMPFDSVVFVRALPRTFIGKVNKSILTSLLRNIEPVSRADDSSIVKDIMDTLREDKII